MSYVVRGRLCGYICTECPEPLSNVTVRLYRLRKDQPVVALAVADPKDTFAVLDGKQVSAKASSLLAEGQTDEEGRFTIDLGEGKDYDGGPFEIDVYCGTVPHMPPRPKPPEPVQFSITTLQPRWRDVEADSVAAWEYCIPYRYWCSVRARFGAWTICGRLTTCEGDSPVPGATVSAFDRDWIQDDPLGQGVTDATGRFRIDYTRPQFERTPISWLSFEWVGGPDVYFQAELGGQVILAESPSMGRTPGRENVGPCLCVELCTERVIGTPETTPHWMRVWDFDIHPAPPSPVAQFSVEGYAGDPSSSFVFGGGVLLRGNCPLRNVAAPTHSLQYRFLIGEWTWPGGTEDPAALPSVAPASLSPVTNVFDTLVGYVFYTNGLGLSDSAPVVMGSGDVSADGWIQIDGKAVTVDIRDGTTATVNVSDSNFLRTFDLMNLNSVAITSAHAPKLPGGLPAADAGRALATGEQEPIRRYRLQFEVRDASTAGTIFSDTLGAIILDNAPVILGLNLTELLTNACNPVSGQSQVHVLYTVDHPHLRTFSVQISNNTGVIHPAPPLPNGAFAPPPSLPGFFFRGGASGSGGTPVGIGADPPCAYAVTLSWLTRRYFDTGHSTQVLYCK